MSDVACVIVNFNSGELCASAVRSVLAQHFEGKGGGEGVLQVVVVDNASPVDQHEYLDPLVALGVDVVYHPENLGYARGMNLGVSRVDADHVIMTNADVLFLPGAIEAMVGHLRRDPAVGLVGPRGYLDPGLFVFLPFNDLPTLSLHSWECLGRVHQSVARRSSLDRTRRSLRSWGATDAIDVNMVSGYCMAMRTDQAKNLGPFDGRYPFYFEDADLCRRVRNGGQRLVIEPEARMIHFFDRSARSVRKEVEEKYEFSRNLYFQSHYGAAGMRLFDGMSAYVEEHRDSEGWRFMEPEDLGGLSGPLSLDLGEKDVDFVAELAVDPIFFFCGGHVDRGKELSLPQVTWNSIDAHRWYLRVIDRSDHSVIRFVTFEKTSPGLAPLSFEECDRLWSSDGGAT